MTKLEQLTEEIKKELPRLMELTDGCIIKTPHWNIFIQMYEKNKYDDYYIFGSSIFNDNYDKICSVANIYKEFSKETSIIGHPILLSDVLDFIYKSNAYIYSKTGEDVAMIHKCIYHYDLSKPYLKDQSEELIDYLHSLI